MDYIDASLKDLGFGMCFHILVSLMHVSLG